MADVYVAQRHAGFRFGYLQPVALQLEGHLEVAVAVDDVHHRLLLGLLHGVQALGLLQVLLRLLCDLHRHSITLARLCSLEYCYDLGLYSILVDRRICQSNLLTVMHS